MSKSSVQDCVDSAGRLAAFINDQLIDCDLMDVLTWCAEANVALARDTTTAGESLELLRGQ